jgi:hypothetical protein
MRQRRLTICACREYWTREDFRPLYAFIRIKNCLQALIQSSFILIYTTAISSINLFYFQYHYIHVNDA